jgi:hypothetical protein
MKMRSAFVLCAALLLSALHVTAQNWTLVWNDESNGAAGCPSRQLPARINGGPSKPVPIWEQVKPNR